MWAMYTPLPFSQQDIPTNKKFVQENTNLKLQPRRVSLTLPPPLKSDSPIKTLYHQNYSPELDRLIIYLFLNISCNVLAIFSDCV